MEENLRTIESAGSAAGYRKLIDTWNSESIEENAWVIETHTAFKDDHLSDWL